MEGSSKKSWKTAVALVLPDSTKMPLVVRALSSAYKSGLDPDMLAVSLATAQLDDGTIAQIKKIYETSEKHPAS